MPISNAEPSELREALRRQGRVLFAVMLRNIRTRFFGHGLGYLIAIGWPLAHTLILLLIFAFSNRAPPVGESGALFLATGAVPFMTFSYLSRFMMMSLMATRPLLSFPEVKMLDVLFASAALELLASCCVTILLLVCAWIYDIPSMPRDIVEAAYAFGAAALLGMGFGLMNGVIVMAMPFWMTFYSLSMILFWLTSGVPYVADALPEPLRTMISYHPVAMLVEWMRSAYYEGYGVGLLDRSYVLKWGVGSAFLGLALERGMRGHLLALR
ncbi:MAG TPA: ABC transporter permease [Methylocystis sp.]|nr:ABC transporter permease [Methylocystis sp.]